ncbi:MAG TPA: hypothetical protein VLF40_01690 [Candidatus Saccharimonadales bacterium]|nr:hypothetical protein [Candidatus Saccharimonadales bacterium]
MSVEVSTGAASEAVSYRQRQPAEWAGLLEIAAVAADPGVPEARRMQVAGSLWDTVRELPPNTNDNCLYYGLGSTAVCAVAQTLVQPARREWVVGHMAGQLVRNHRAYARIVGEPDNVGLYIGELSEATKPEKSRLTRRAMEQAFNRQPAAPRLLTNALFEVARGLNLGRPGTPEAEQQKRRRLRHVFGKGRALNYVLNSTTTGASELLVNGLLLHAGVTHGQTELERAVAVCVTKLDGLVDAGTLRNLIPATFANKAASLHEDVFFKDLPKEQSLDETGALSVEPEVLIKLRQYEEEPGKRSRIGSHEMAIGCPALYASVKGPEGTEKLTAIMAGLLAEAAVRAQERLLSRRLIDRIARRIMSIGARKPPIVDSLFMPYLIG